MALGYSGTRQRSLGTTTVWGGRDSKASSSLQATNMNTHLEIKGRNYTPTALSHQPLTFAGCLKLKGPSTLCASRHGRGICS